MKAVHYTEKYMIDPYDPVTVDLIGCGGTGSQVLTGLARMDAALVALGHQGLYVRAFDPDFVDTPNLGRQLFSTSEVGLNKAAVLVTRINRFFGLNWKAYPDRFENAVLEDYNMRSANIVITCVDTAKARIKVGELLKKDSDTYRGGKTYYWLDFGNTQRSGQVVLGTVAEIKQPESNYRTVGVLPTVVDMFPDILEEDRNQNQGPSCSLAEALARQDLFVNSILAQVGLDILWKLFRDIKIRFRGAFLNLDLMRCNPIAVEAV